MLETSNGKEKQRQRPIKKRPLTDEDEEKIEKAKQAYEAHAYSSIKATAIAHNVPYFTLHQRVDSESLPYENQIPVASSSRIQLPFQPVPSSYFNTFSVESSYYHT